MIALFQHEDGIPIPSATESPDFVYTFYALISTSNTGEWTVNIDTSALVTLDDMETAIATAVATKEGLIKDAAVKNSIADADSIAVVDSADSKTKRVLWSTIKSALGQVFAPLTRKINNKPLSSDVVLTGDDIATSATDGTTVSSSLSNKVGNQALEIPNSDCNDIADFGLYRVQNDTANGYTSTVGDSVINAPWDMNTMFQLFLSASAGKMLWRTKVSALENPWSEWFPLANATPPQEFDLPLAEGFSSLGSEPSTYWKNQFGEVTVILQVKKNQPISDGEIAAYLPAGFSPSMQLRYPCLAPASRSMGFLYVYPNGGIAISFSGGAFPDVLASFTFLAAN